MLIRKQKKRDAFSYVECQKCHFVFTTRDISQRHCHGCRGTTAPAKKQAPAST